MVLRARKAVWRWGRSCGLGYCRFEHADQIRLSLVPLPGQLRSCWHAREGEAAMAARKKKDADAAGSPAGDGGDGAEVSEDQVRVVERAAAIDVAKGSGMVCTRVPGSRPDRRRQKVWQVTATYREVIELMDHLRSQGIQRLVLESTSDYWRLWYYLAEAAGLEVWLVNARDGKHPPGLGKSDRAACVWLCKLNERGMLRRSFVPPQAVRDLRALTRTRSRLAQDQARHQARVEKILEDALLKISVVISDLFGASGRRFLDALVAGQRSPAGLAALGDPRLKATRRQLEEALTGQFRDIHAFEIKTHLRILDVINEEIARLDEITGVGLINARVLIAELGTDPSQFPTPGHAAAWARLTPRTLQSGQSARPGRTGKGDPYLRGALGQCVMAIAHTDTRLGAMYRRIARKRGKQKAIV